MATETVASDHTSATNEKIVKKEKSEAIAQMIDSLANEDENKHDKPEDAPGQDTPSSKTEGEAKADETKTELAAVEVEKSDDSPSLEASAQDMPKDDEVKDAQTPAAPVSKMEEEAEGDEKKAEPAVVAVEKTDDPVSLEANVADNLKEEKELIPDSQTISVATEPAHDAVKSESEEPSSSETTVKETPQHLEKESTETGEKEQSKTAEIPEASAETIEKSSNTAEANPLTAKVDKEAEILEASAQKEEKPEPEPVATEVQEKTEEVEKDSQEKPQEAEQPSTTAIREPSAEANEKPSDAIEEEKAREPSAEGSKDTNDHEAGPTEAVTAEPVVTEVEESPKEPEKQSLERKEEEQPNTVAIPEVPSVETIEDAEEKSRESELDAEVLKETKHETEPTETEKAEPVVTKVNENPKEQEKQSLEQKEKEQPNTVAIPEAPSAETSEALEEKSREPEFDREVLKETKHETEPTETEKAEPVVTKVDENPSEPEKKSFKQDEEEQPKVVIPETPKLEAESAANPGNIVEAHPPKESDVEVVKETSNSESEAVPREEEKSHDIVVINPPKESDIEVLKDNSNSESEAVPEKEVKPEPVSTEVGEKPRELLEVVDEVGETIKDPDTKQEIVPEASKVEGTSVDTIKEPISLKEEKSDKEVTSIPKNTAQVSLNEKDQEAQANVVKPFPELAEEIVEEDGKKEPSFTDAIKGVSKEVAGVLENPEQASVDHVAKTDLKEETQFSASTNVVEKAAVTAANDDKKELRAPVVVQLSSREAEVEMKKIEEQNEAKTTATEAGAVQVESVKEDRTAVDNEKEAHTDTKVDEISSAVSQPVRETLASKFEEEESAKTGEDNLEKEQTEEPVKTEVQAPEPSTKESAATKISRDLPKETPAKPAQKQSNNIISKVKQSLVKAKKAIIGKSPSSKNHSSEAKDEIKVK